VPPLVSRPVPINASDRAGLVRVAFATAAVLFADSVCPDQSSVQALSVAYLLSALLFQFAIYQGWGQGQLRSLVMGLVDIGFLTYPVHLLGPAHSVLPFGYLLIPVVNAAASSSRARVAMWLAVAGATVYALLLLANGAGLLAYAPGSADRPLPNGSALIASGTLVIMSVLLTTSIVLRQMTALDHMNRQLQELSGRDELTGLANRRTLFAELRRQLDRVARGASSAVLMLDLDGFKAVNDSLGHHAGDELLRDIASVLSQELRAIDVLARYGGDEFVVLLPDVTAEGSLAVAERVVCAVRQLGRDRWPRTPVTVSVGVALSSASDDVASLLRRADMNAYSAKRAGGNRAVLADAFAAAPNHAAPAEPQALLG
jgi:diguanylate cyclase (GGDEF)-like protein